MGTSSSSRGPGPNVPFVPPWVPPLPPPLPPPLEQDAGPPPADGDGNPPSPPPPHAPPPAQPPIAPARRYQAARTSLGNYARTGSRDDLKRGLGHYTATGLGGSAQATRRMARTAVNAGKLYSALSALSSGTALPADVPIDRAAMAGRPAREIADEIAKALQPSDGTQDAEASRDAISRSLSELLIAEPDVDMLALTPVQIDLVIQTYVGEDLCRRIDLDVGKTIIDKAATLAEGQSRLEDMKAYVRQEVARLFRARSDGGQRLSRQNAASMASGVIQSTFDVFEEYLR